MIRFASAAGALLILAGVAAAAPAAFAPLDLDELASQAADYRHRAALLRKSAGLRERSISEAQQRADQILQSAQADALRKQQLALQGQADAQTNQDAFGLAASFLPGGDSLFKSAVKGGLRVAGNAGVTSAAAGVKGAALEGSDAVTQAHQAAAPLREQAKALEGDKKRLALKADQYEKLADAKELLIAAETLRLRAESAPKSADETDKEVAEARRFVQNQDLWP